MGRDAYLAGVCAGDAWRLKEPLGKGSVYRAERAAGAFESILMPFEPCPSLLEYLPCPSTRTMPKVTRIRA